MVDYDQLSGYVDEIASEFLFLSGKDIDVPTAGKFLNILENIGGAAKTLKILPMEQAAQGIGALLEKIILDAVSDREGAYNALEQGITLIQTVVNAHRNTGAFADTAQMDAFLKRIAELTGFVAPASAEAAPPTEPEPVQASPAENAAPKAPTSVIAGQDESLLRDFITESLEYIEQIEVNILNLEQNPEDKDVINAIFRPFHSVKGVAGFLNLEVIRNLAHSLENLLDKARNGEMEVSPAMIDIILDGADTLKTLILQIRDELEGRGLPEEELDLTDLLQRVHALEQGITPEPKVKKVGEILIDQGTLTKDKLEEGLKTVQEQPGTKIGEALITQGLATPKQVSSALRKQAEQATDATTIRVDVRKLDDMIDMVGELVITQTMLQQDIVNLMSTDRNLMRDVAQLFRISAALQRSTTGLRMIPIKQTFQRMSRLIRDLGKSGGKNVTVGLVGEDTEIDRNMVEEIYNPLVHMVRNSVDHGLEAPEERVAKGKSDKGLIELKAYHRGGNIVIEIADDGRGLSKEKILKKAISNGLITETDSHGMTDGEIFRLVFAPGLSTAEKITDVSGRGVGMDVVKQAVDKLRGKIEITSTPGRGTTFITSFPLTMAIIDGMIVRVGRERFILPTTAIRQALRPSREAYTNVVGRGEMIGVMGSHLPLVRLGQLFGIPADKTEPWESIIVVMEGDGRSKCLLVDEILGKAEVVIKSLGQGIRNVRGIAGGAILGDGQIGLILDTEGLFLLSETTA